MHSVFILRIWGNRQDKLSQGATYDRKSPNFLVAPTEGLIHIVYFLNHLEFLIF